MDVTVGVAVGVGVTLGILEGVDVGPVAVGKGPIRARDVSAIDVRVLFALSKRFRLEPDGWIKAKK